MAQTPQEKEIGHPHLFLGVAATTFLVIFFFLPLGTLLVEAFKVGIQFPEVDELSTLAFTSLGLAGGSVLLSAMVGTFLAFTLSEVQSVPRILSAILNLPFFVPTLLICFFLIDTWGSSLFGVQGILIAHALINYPLFLSLILSRIQSVERFDEMVAISLGSPRWKVWCQLAWPKILPSVKSAILLSFLYCLNSLTVVLLMGGTPPLSTFETVIYQSIKMDFDLPAATSLMLFQTVFGLGLFSLLGWIGNIPSRTSARPTPIYLTYSPKWRVSLLMASLLFPFLFLILPGFHFLQSLLMHSNLDLSQISTSLLQTLQIGLLTASLSTLIAFMTSYALQGKRSLTFLTLLPLTVSPLFLGLAYFFFFSTHQTGALGWVAILQTICFLPITCAIYKNGMDLIDPQWIRTSRSLGASPFKTLLSLELPILSPQIRWCFFLSFALSSGDVASLFVVLPHEKAPLSLSIFRKLQSYQIEEGLQMVALLLGLIASFLILGSWKRRVESRFAWV